MILHTGTGAIVPVPVVFFRRTYMRKRKGKLSGKFLPEVFSRLCILKSVMQVQKF